MCKRCKSLGPQVSPHSNASNYASLSSLTNFRILYSMGAQLVDKLKSYKNTFKINQKRPKEQPQHISILPVCVGGGGQGVEDV